MLSWWQGWCVGYIMLRTPGDWRPRFYVYLDQTIILQCVLVFWTCLSHYNLYQRTVVCSCSKDLKRSSARPQYDCYRKVLRKSQCIELIAKYLSWAPSHGLKGNCRAIFSPPTPESKFAALLVDAVQEAHCVNVWRLLTIFNPGFQSVPGSYIK